MGEPMRSLVEQFARRDDPPHRPSGILYVVGEADLAYLQSVVWDPADAAWGRYEMLGRYETLMAQARPQLALQLPEQGPLNTVWGHDQFGRVVILARETYKGRWAYFVEWPSSLPEAPYPDDAHIVGNDVLSERLGERPVYIKYPSGALDLLPVIPDRRLWLVPPFKWGYSGIGPNCLEDAIEYACCSAILDKAPRRYRPRYIGTEVSAEAGTWSGSYLRAARNTLK